MQTFDDKVIININDILDCPIGKKPINRYHLNGLTFYCNNSKPHNIVFKNKLCQSISNPPDETGQKSLSIPWEKLEYPKIDIL